MKITLCIHKLMGRFYYQYETSNLTKYANNGEPHYYGQVRQGLSQIKSKVCNFVAKEQKDD
jgi:hypothetical protein